MLMQMSTALSPRFLQMNRKQKKKVMAQAVIRFH